MQWCRGQQQGVAPGHEAGDGGVARGSAGAQVVRFVDNDEGALRRLLADEARVRIIGHGGDGYVVLSRESVHRVQADVWQLRVRDGRAPHGLQRRRRDDVHLCVRAGHGERRVGFAESYVVGQEGAVMQADGRLNAGHGITLVGEQCDVAEFRRRRRGHEGAGQPSLHVARTMVRPRHGVYHASNGVRCRSGTS